MKEPIEELFKESLKGHEMPYNPEAWKAMSARLDVVSPVAQPTSYLKYYLGAAGVGAVAIATYFIFAGGNTSENTKEPIAKQETTLEQTSTGTTKPSSSNSDAQTGNTSVISNSEETPTSSDERLQGSSVELSNSDIKADLGTKTNHEKPASVISYNPTQATHANTSSTDNGNTTPTEVMNTELTNTPSTFTTPEVSDLCLNEASVISNPNDQVMYVLDAINGVVETVPSNKSILFTPTVVGSYSLGYEKDGEIEAYSNFVVNRIPDAHFTIDLVNKYENGLPATHVEAIGGQGTYVWTAEKQSASGTETDLRFFKKGSHNIKLTVDNGQCASSMEKTIYVEQDYNLMAVNSFTPTSINPVNTTFMPFALTQRPDVNFMLTIIDSRDGGIVYQTSDASLPWDGTDIRLGRRSEVPQVYVWKAVILNPQENEPTEYKGTITMN